MHTEAFNNQSSIYTAACSRNGFQFFTNIKNKLKKKYKQLLHFLFLEIVTKKRISIRDKWSGFLEREL